MWVAVRSVNVGCFADERPLTTTDCWQKVYFRIRAGALQQAQCGYRIADRDRQAGAQVVVLAEPLFDSGKALLQIFNDLTHVRSANFNNFLPLGQRTHRRWNEDAWHSNCREGNGLMLD